MATIMPYNRNSAVFYANEWALKRNPKYYDFSDLGGDCTNFVSQCLYAGSDVMNFTKTFGWYYKNSYNRTASWTGVEYLYKFLITNQTQGVFAKEVSIDEVMIGDIIQLGDENQRFYHSLIITNVTNIPKPSTILIATHTLDSYRRPLNTYYYANVRYLHIQGVYQNY